MTHTQDFICLFHDSFLRGKKKSVFLLLSSLIKAGSFHWLQEAVTGEAGHEFISCYDSSAHLQHKNSLTVKVSLVKKGEISKMLKMQERQREADLAVSFCS